VLDVLDECHEELRIKLVSVLEGLERDASKPIKVFISSLLDP
jgi:hypothetical protein